MTTQDKGSTPEIAQKANAFAALVPDDASSFAGDLQHFKREVQALLDAVRGSGAQFAFDRDGRPDAIAALRAALPTMERDLLNAVLEDHDAEIAAWQEALYQGLVARSRRSG